MLKILLRNDVIVICAGGGGIPVVRRRDGSLVGVEAVIDKDAASALLAEQIDADALLLLTDVDAVYRDFGTPQAQRVSALSVDDLDYISLPAGSMLPKAKAAARFAGTGKIAAIGRLEDASSILRGSAGTRIRAH